MQNQYTITDLTEVVRKLRSPQGCPWDKVQTHESLQSCLIEECYEVIEAISNQDTLNLREELGDVLLQVIFHSVLAQEKEQFTLDDVISEVTQKMIRRHPAIFAQAENQEQKLSWEEIKKQEKQEKRRELEELVQQGKIDPQVLKIREKNPLEQIPKAFPGTIRTQKVVRKAVREYGETFRLTDTICQIESLLENLKLKQEVNEQASKDNYDNKNESEDIVGKLLFDVVSIAEEMGVNAEKSLTKATEKYINRTVRSEAYKL